MWAEWHADEGGEPGVQVERTGMEAHAGNPSNPTDLRDLTGRVFEATKTLQKRQCWQLSGGGGGNTKSDAKYKEQRHEVVPGRVGMAPSNVDYVFFSLLKAKIMSSESDLSHNDRPSLCCSHRYIQISSNICHLCCLFNVIPPIQNQSFAGDFLSCSVHWAHEWMKGFLCRPKLVIQVICITQWAGTFHN